MEDILKNRIRALEQENENLKEENKQLRTRAGGGSNDSSTSFRNGFGRGFSYDSVETSNRDSPYGFGFASKNTPAQASTETMLRPTFMVTERFKAFGFGLKRLEWESKARVNQIRIYFNQNCNI